MLDDTSGIAPIGFSNFRQQQKKFGIKLDDRRRHVYIIGKTGVGKSTLLENMVIADIRAGKGVAFFDPHGESAEKLLDFIPEERLDDVIYFDPSDLENPIAFNPMEQVGTEFRHLVASGIMGVFKKIWPDAWSARMEYILNNTILALLEYPDSTILGVMRMFSEPNYRKKIVDNLKDPVIRAFWVNEFSKYTQRLETEALAAIQNKVGQFISNPLIRNIMGQPRSAIDMRDIMDSGKILIVNLSKGKIGEDNSRLLGAMMISRLQLAAMSRVDIPEDKRNDFFLYVDEFQNFATESFANILSEARKYRLGLILAHQYISQLVDADNTKVRDAVFGNIGTIISFRVGGADAEFLEKEFMPEFTENDLVNLAKANVYIKLTIDGVASRPFSAETIPPERPPLVSYRDVIIKNTQKKYGTPRAIVDAKIASEWETTSEAILDEKIGRRGEKRLHDVLKSDTWVEKQKPQRNNREAPDGGNAPQTAPGSKKEHPVSPASIDEMRRVINESLKKQSE
jgi:energy-coupling factor transporter ATP-binding protein EcfA2